MADLINGYELLNPFQNQDAGFSRWTTALKNGETYFLKEFISPKYPDESTLTENLRNTRIRECKTFEEEKSRLFREINKASDGNLVRITEFFRADARYYLTTEWIKGGSLSFSDISRMNMQDKLILCMTAAHALAGLHAANIAHSDIKETNVLVRVTARGKPVAKIIDFGCSFFVDNPPKDEDDLGGDQVYLSPEACLFFNGEDVRLSGKMDVFALGLLFHQYMTGDLPYFDKSEYDYAHEAVLDGFVLRADTADIPYTIGAIIEKMLLRDPEDRISMQEVYFLLSSYYKKMYKGGHAEGWNTDNGGTEKSTVRSSKLKMSKEFFKSGGDLKPVKDQDDSNMPVTMRSKGD